MGSPDRPNTYLASAASSLQQAAATSPLPPPGSARPPWLPSGPRSPSPRPSRIPSAGCRSPAASPPELCTPRDGRARVAERPRHPRGSRPTPPSPRAARPPAAPRFAGGAAVTRQGGNAGARPRRREEETASALGSAPGRPDSAQPGRCGAGRVRRSAWRGPGRALSGARVPPRPGARSLCPPGRLSVAAWGSSARRSAGGSPGPRAGQRVARTWEPT